jgi:bifunctional ADP-heptose synthase (sugar kinase/adenylyltransferase)
MGEYIPYDQDRLEEIVNEIRKDNLIILTGGSFDPFHIDHMNFLRNCRKYGYNLLEEFSKSGVALFVNVKNDERVTLTKGQDRPVFNEIYRAKMVSGLDSVDYSTVHPLYHESPTREVAKIIRPDILMKGDDGWKIAEKIKLKNYLNYSVKFGSIKRKGGTSSTEILQGLNVAYLYS